VGEEHTPPPATVHADDHRLRGVLVPGSDLRPRPGALPGPDADVRLVPVPWTAAAHPASASMSAHDTSNPGRVLAVLSMSSTRTPGTTRPTIAPAVAMRWSA